jgi:integrase
VSESKRPLPDLRGLIAILDAFPSLAEALRRMMDPRELVTVGEVVRAYLQDTKGQLTERVYGDHELILTRFGAAHGPRKVVECGPLDLRRFVQGHEQWRSGWTKKRVCAVVHRCFNWAVQMKLARENVFKGVSYQARERRREMTDAEFRTLLRFSDAKFRRFLLFLRYTGCRPGEASKLEWRHIDFERKLAVLSPEEHKTGRKTGKPRTILLPPILVRMLRYLERRRPYVATADWLKQLLADAGGSLPKKAVTKAARRFGITDRMLWRAREALGVTFRRVGGIAARGHWVYELPSGANGTQTDAAAARALRALLAAGPVPAGEVLRRMRAKGFSRHAVFRALAALGARRRYRGTRAGADGRAVVFYTLPGQPAAPPFPPRKSGRGRDHVFTNDLGNPWHRSSLSLRMQRLRKEAGLPGEVTLYMLRHRYATDAIRMNANLMTLANLLGHVGTRMLDTYVHIADDPAFLVEEARKIAESMMNRRPSNP